MFVLIVELNPARLDINFLASLWLAHSFHHYAHHYRVLAIILCNVHKTFVLDYRVRLSCTVGLLDFLRFLTHSITHSLTHSLTFLSFSNGKTFSWDLEPTVK